MKFLFKFILPAALFSGTTTFARDIILIENQSTLEAGRMLVRVLETKFNMPRKFITYKPISGPCKKNSEAILQLCLRNDGELDIVKIDKFVMENSIGAFLEMED